MQLVNVLFQCPETSRNILQPLFGMDDVTEDPFASSQDLEKLKQLFVVAGTVQTHEGFVEL